MTRKSGTVSGNRRGRPRGFPLGADAEIRELWGGLITSLRGVRNKEYARVGAGAIVGPDGWLNPKHAWFATERRVRQGILTELGRIAMRFGRTTAVAMADKLADKVAAGELASTRDAAAWLRQARLRQSGCRKPATAGALERTITTTIINWMSEHPDATPALVGEALSGAYSLVEVVEDICKRRNGVAGASEEVAP